MRSFIGLITMACWALSAGQAVAAERVALLIGNSAYEHTTRLTSPGRDVEAMAAALTRLGFDVRRATDADERAMVREIRAFSRKAGQADTALLYYSGHGMEIAGRNYLVPVDARLEREGDAGFEAIGLDDVIAAASGAARLSVVILDACRDNRFPGSAKNGAKGFSPIRARPGQLIAFAAAPGAVAYDGGGRMSPFTQALTEALADPTAATLDVRQLFGGLGPRTAALAKGPQEPFTHAAGFGPASVTLTGASASVTGDSAPAGDGPSRAERLAYDVAVSVGTVAALDAFINAFPNSSLKSEADALRRVLRASGGDAQGGAAPEDGPTERAEADGPPWDGASAALNAAERRSLADRLRRFAILVSETEPRPAKLRPEFDDRRCRFDPKTQSLTLARSRLSRFVDEARAQIRRPTNIHGWEDVTFARSLSDLKARAEILALLPDMAQRLRNDKHAKTLLYALRDYWEKTTSTPGWEEKLDTIYKATVNLSNYQQSALAWNSPFHAVGFPPPRRDEACLNQGGFPTVSIDTWLYSFWMRRRQEGTMRFTKAALDWIIKTEFESE